MFKEDRLLYITLAIYIITNIITATTIYYIPIKMEIFVKVIRYICYIIFILNILKNYKNISKQELLCLILSIIILIFTKNRNILIITLIMMSVKKLSLKKILKVALIVYLSIYLLVILLSVVKIIPDWTYLRYGITRHSLGFIYPTDCYSIFFLITLLYLYNKEEKISIISIVLIFIINNILIYLTNGRMSYILINITLLVSTIFKTNLIKYINRDKLQKTTKIIAYILPSIFLILTNVLVILYVNQNSIIEKVDEILSDRIELTAKAYSQYDITLFGQKTKWYGYGGYGYLELDKDYKYNYVDNSYARSILDYGIIFTIIVIVAYTLLLVNLSKKEDYILYSIICIVLIWAFIEPCLLNLGRNIFMLCFIDMKGSNTINVKNKKNSKKKLHI